MRSIIPLGCCIPVGYKLAKCDLKGVLGVGEDTEGNSFRYLATFITALAHDDSSGLLKTPGEGLGLAIIKELSRLFDGEVSFESETNKGTTFWFTAPFYKNYEEIPPKEAHTAPQSLKILLVEDNFLNQRFAKATLTKAGHSVDLAENGKIALIKFRENPYDIILMDVQLPIMDGLEATRQIRELEKESGKRSRIVAVTAYALEKTKKLYGSRYGFFLSQAIQADSTAQYASKGNG